MTPKLSFLTDEQIRVMIAEECGWTRADDYCDSEIAWRNPKNQSVVHAEHLPNYTDSLDACHEMEATLRGNVEQDARYWEILHSLETEEKCTGHWLDLKATGHATAPQRCKAFLLAIGKAKL